MPHDHHDHDAHSLLPSDPALRVKALETLLTRKGLVDPAAMDTILDLYENMVGPQNGARVVARAWAEPAFLAALRADTTATLAREGLLGRQGEHVVVVENTPEVHNVVVCTLCSCYPWPLLGIPPSWYKSDAYRARVVREPGVRFRLSMERVEVPKTDDRNADVQAATANLHAAFERTIRAKPEQWMWAHRRWG